MVLSAQSSGLDRSFLNLFVFQVVELHHCIAPTYHIDSPRWGLPWVNSQDLIENSEGQVTLDFIYGKDSFI